MLLQVSSRRGRWTRFRQVQQMAGGCAVGYGAALRDLGTALEQICGLPSMGDHRAHPPHPHLPVTTVSLFPEPCRQGSWQPPPLPAEPTPCLVPRTVQEMAISPLAGPAWSAQEPVREVPRDHGRGAKTQRE